MGLSLLESLRRLVRQDLTRIQAPVGNFHGAVAGTLDLLEAEPGQSWLVLTEEGAALPSLDEFYTRYDVAVSGNALLLPASSGKVAVSVDAGQVALVRTTVTVTRAQTIALTLGLETTSSAAAVYLNGVLQRRVEGPQASVPLPLAPGQHTLAVVVLSPRVILTLPSNLAVAGTMERLNTPQWRSVTTGYLDSQVGTVANTLEWVSDPQVGGYRVLRRTIQYVADPTVANNGRILEVGSVDRSNRFLLVLEGDQSARVSTGSPMVVDGTTIGVVSQIVVNGSTSTELLCRLPTETPSPTSALVGKYCYTGPLAELTRVAQENVAPILSYQDSQVTFGQEYEYALQAYGLVDESSLSSVSTLAYLRAGDLNPPGPITFLPGYPKVLNRIATVKFTTPAELDYQGVRVYFRDRVLNPNNDNNPFTLQAYNTSTKQLTIQGATALPLDLTGFLVRFGTSPATYTVASSTAYGIVLHNGPDVAPAVGSNLAIYKDTLLKTDFGSPDREDELSCELPEYGLYYFAAFDRSNNEQSPSDATSWIYTPEADGFSGPPVLAIRQLTPTEQSFFFLSALGTVSITTGGVATFSAAQTLQAGHTIKVGTTTYTVQTGSGTAYTVTPNPGTAVTNQTFQRNCTDIVQYVVLELWAYDPTKAENVKYEGVTLYYQRVGQDASPVVMDPIPNPEEAFPNEVATETLSKNVTTTLNSANVTTTSTVGLKPGMVLSGNPNVPANATILSITNATTFVISANATGGATNIGTTFTYSTDLQAIFDNPPTTRSRFVLVNRDYPQVQVWAENELGQQSDIATYVADHDTTPEVILETTINPLNDTFTAVVVADDDTNAFTWQVDDSPVYTVDTRSLKRVVLSPALSVANGRNYTNLALGQRKVLTITPYADYTAGPPVTVSRPGSVITRELVRTPRSGVTFENRDASGNRSALSVTASFSMTPAWDVVGPIVAATQTVAGVSYTIVTVGTTNFTQIGASSNTAGAVFTATGVGTGTGTVRQNRTGTLTLVSGTYRLTDAATPGWTTNQYRSGATVFYYAVLKPAGRTPVVCRITANTTTYVELESVSDLPAFTGQTVPYEIRDGAVLYRRVATTAAAFEGTAGVQVFDRTSAFELEFYATKNGCYPESPRRVLVDSDGLPTISGFKYRIDDTNPSSVALLVGFDNADDDATTWEVYERKVPVGSGALWPTVTGALPPTTRPPDQNSLDRQYLRFTGSVDQTFYRRMMPQASGTWYAVAVPYNAYGESGIAQTDSFAIGSAVSPQLLDLSFSPNVGATTVGVSFSATSTTSSGASVSVTAVRPDSPNTTLSATGTVASGVTLNLQETIVASGGVSRTYDVTAVLAGGNTITRSFTTQVQTGTGGGGGGGATTITLTGSQSISREGSCFGAGSGSPNCGHYLSGPHTRLVTWQLYVNGSIVSSVASPYYIRVEYSPEQNATAGSQWFLIADGLPAAQQSYTHATECLYADVSGVTRYWTYRVTATDASGTTVTMSGSPVQTQLTPQLQQATLYCGGDGGNQT